MTLCDLVCFSRGFWFVFLNEGEGLSRRTYKKKMFEWAYPEVAQWCRNEGREYPELNEKGEIIEELPRTTKMRH